MDEQSKTETSSEDGRQDGLRDVVATAMKRGRALRKWRQEDLSQACSRLGSTTLTRQAIASIERGERRVDLGELFFLCHALDRTIADMLNDDPFLAEIPIDVVLVEPEEVIQALVTGRKRKQDDLTYDSLANIDERIREIAIEVANQVINQRFHLLLKNPTVYGINDVEVTVPGTMQDFDSAADR